MQGNARKKEIRAASVLSRQLPKRERIYNLLFSALPAPVPLYFERAGSTKRRMYVDLICMDPTDPRERPRISLDKLKKEIPGFDWSKGHSGALVPEDVVKKLDKLDDEEEDDDFPLAN